MLEIFLISAKKGLFSIYTFISDKILPYAISPNFIENNGMNDTIYKANSVMCGVDIEKNIGEDSTY